MALLEKIAAAAGFRAPDGQAAAHAQSETYTLFVGHGRWLLADDFGSSDPFCLLPGQIVDRVLLAGHRAVLDRPGRGSAAAAAARAEEVERDGRRFRVWRDAEAETIIVQEIRARPPGPDAAARNGRPG